MFVYYDGKHQLFSSIINSKIEPSLPVKLVMLGNIGTATVSNVKNFNLRCIVRSLKLEMRDKYNNHVAKGMNGKVNVSVSCQTDEKVLPLLTGMTNKQKQIAFTLSAGTCTVQNVCISEGSPGIDGCQYALVFSVDCDTIQNKTDIESLQLPFLFYDDAKKQQEMASLTKERDSLQNAIRTYKSLFETSEQLIEELKISVKEAKADELKVREELRKLNVPNTSLTS
ncbi:hypothetical protein DPMN_072619, partial [Dreissena polymorpha]